MNLLKLKCTVRSADRSRLTDQIYPDSLFLGYTYTAPAGLDATIT